MFVLVFSGLDVLVVFADCRCRQCCQEQQPNHVEHRGWRNVEDELEEKSVQLREEHEDEEQEHLDEKLMYGCTFDQVFEIGHEI